MGSGTTTGKSVVVEPLSEREQGRHDDQDKKGQNKCPFEKKF